MKNGATRGAIAMVCLTASIGTTGCGTLFDVTYLLGSKRYDESKEERKPTGQSTTAIEYDAAVAPDGTIQLTCEERERRIERTFSVNKTYEYRGGYNRSMYVTGAILSAVAGGAVAGIVAIACNLPPQPGEKDPKRWSCINALYATPFAADMGYSIIRAVMAKTPKLVDKTKNEGLLQLSPVPTRATRTSCESLDKVVLGMVTGPSDAEALNGLSSQEQRLSDGALPVTREPDGSIKLLTQPDLVHAWIANPASSLVAVDRNGKPRAIQMDRCGALRPTITVMQGQEMSMFFQQCPAPTAPVQR